MSPTTAGDIFYIHIRQKKRVPLHSPMGWVSYLHRAATTNYLCCGQALEDSKGAGRIGLTRFSLFAGAKVDIFFDLTSKHVFFFKKT